MVGFQSTLTAGVSPGLTAGSGLKPRIDPTHRVSDHRISRLNRREWIETGRCVSIWRTHCVSPGLTAGSGLKLPVRDSVPGWPDVSPGLTAGSGLKLRADARHRPGTGVSPGLTAGSGLKPVCRPASDRISGVSPGLTAGSGLKPSGIGEFHTPGAYLPA